MPVSFVPLLFNTGDQGFSRGAQQIDNAYERSLRNQQFLLQLQEQRKARKQQERAQKKAQKKALTQGLITAGIGAGAGALGGAALGALAAPAATAASTAGTAAGTATGATTSLAPAAGVAATEAAAQTAAAGSGIIGEAVAPVAISGPAAGAFSAGGSLAPGIGTTFGAAPVAGSVAGAAGGATAPAAQGAFSLTPAAKPIIPTPFQGPAGASPSTFSARPFALNQPGTPTGTNVGGLDSKIATFRAPATPSSPNVPTLTPTAPRAESISAGVFPQTTRNASPATIGGIAGGAGGGAGGGYTASGVRAGTPTQDGSVEAYRARVLHNAEPRVSTANLNPNQPLQSQLGRPVGGNDFPVNGNGTPGGLPPGSVGNPNLPQYPGGSQYLFGNSKGGSIATGALLGALNPFAPGLLQTAADVPYRNAKFALDAANLGLNTTDLALRQSRIDQNAAIADQRNANYADRTAVMRERNNRPAAAAKKSYPPGTVGQIVAGDELLQSGALSSEAQKRINRYLDSIGQPRETNGGTKFTGVAGQIKQLTELANDPNENIANTARATLDSMGINPTIGTVQSLVDLEGSGRKLNAPGSTRQPGVTEATPEIIDGFLKGLSAEGAGYVDIGPDGTPKINDAGIAQVDYFVRSNRIPAGTQNAFFGQLKRLGLDYPVYAKESRNNRLADLERILQTLGQ